MVVDTSALIAVLEGEETAPRIARAMVEAPRRFISTATLVEAGIVAERHRGEQGGRELDLLLHRLRVEVVPLTAEHAEIARSAYRDYGKGRHPAGLNLGDLFSYALATTLGEPLLFVGNDFSKTDVEKAPY